MFEKQEVNLGLEDLELAKKWALEEQQEKDSKINALNLPTEMIDELKRSICKTYHGPDLQDDYSNKFLEMINLTELVGTVRLLPRANASWLECLEDCHKMYHFDGFSQESYESLLLNPPQEDLPHVIKYNDEYYIAWGGKHRLTIGKCIGAAQAKVYVTEITE